MTPDFALSLSFEGIRLLHRGPLGWTPVGDVSLDFRDLAGDLAALRRAGQALGAPWRGTMLLLPADQVRFMALDGGVGEAEARAALGGVTPYAVDDLVIDHVRAGGRTHVAAVVRETLEEAEAFAAEHGFQPVGFAAETSESGFPGRPFFGPTTRATAILGGETVEREALDPPFVESPPGDSDVKGAESPDLASPKVVEEDEAPQVLRVAPAPTPQPELAAEAPSAKPALAAEPTSPPSPAPVAEAPTAMPPATVEPPYAPAPDGAATGTSETLPPAGRAAPLSATGVPELVFASRTRPLRGQTRGVGAPVADAPKGAGQRRKAAARVEPKVMATPPAAAAPAEGWALSAPPPSARRDPRAPPDPAPGSIPARKEPPVALPSSGVAAHPRVTALQREPDPLPKPATEAARLTIFGARPREQTDRVGGKPRHLGLLLTILLLAVMLAVALLASRSEGGLAGLFRQATAPATEIAAAPPDAEPEAAPPPTELASSEPAVVPARPEPEATEAGPSPVDLASSESPAAPARPEPEATEAAAAAVAAAISALPVARDAPDAPAPGLALAEEFYASTGVWIGDPGLPTPETKRNEPVLATRSADAAPEASVQALVALSPDAPLAAPSDPPPPVPEAVATVAPAEGARPEGVQVVAGPPPAVLVPPALLGPDPAGVWVNAMAEPPGLTPRLRPERPVLPDEALAALDPPAVEPDAWVNAMAEPPGHWPPPRPTPSEEVLAALAPPAETPALPDAGLPGTLAFAPSDPTSGALAVTPGAVGLAGLRPIPRPEGLAPEAEAEEPAPVILAAYDGPRPGPRPEGLAPEPPEGPDVGDALAQALADPAPEAAAPAAPDLQSTLAAIVAGSPDPLAGATARAVPLARRPDARPQNFGRVVAEQLDRLARSSQPRESSAPRVAASDLSANEAAESTPEAASSAAAAPSGPVTATVAQAATIADAMALREMNLIGVYGQPGARHALVRLGNGRYLRVSVGDSLDGGQVTAIGDNALNYVKRGRTEVLVIPGG